MRTFSICPRRNARCSLHRCARSLAGLPHSRPAGWMCPDDVAAAVANVQDEVARYNAEQADEAASGGKESSSIG